MWVGLAGESPGTLIQRATDGQAAAVEHMGVDDLDFDMAAAAQILDGADIVAGFEQMSGDAVAKGAALPPICRRRFLEPVHRPSLGQSVGADPGT